jgi:hypothetical protein
MIEHAPPAKREQKLWGRVWAAPGAGAVEKDGHDIISEQVGWITMDAFRVET